MTEQDEMKKISKGRHGEISKTSYGKKDYHKRDYHKRDYYKRDYAKRIYAKRNYEKSNYEKRNSLFSLKNYVIFFLLVCFICLCSILLYAKSVSVYGKSLYDWRAICAVLVNVFFISAVITIIDSMRRRFTIEMPVRRIMETVGRISRGKYGIQIEPSYTRRINEFDDIIDGINQMSKELARTETLKTDFIANVTHEIKTPLAIIQNYASMLQDEELDGETRQEYVQTLLDASRRLSGLVANMLKLNKLENQEISLENQEFNVGEQVRSVLLSFEGAWSGKDLEIDVDIEDTMICCDEGLLEIVWSNLISNAIKFTPEGGSLGVSVKQGKDAVAVSVQDSGCGMDEATGRHIFDKFYQGDTSHAKEGNGLGLAMVKRVMDIVGGEIYVDSKLGSGSTFTVIVLMEPGWADNPGKGD